LKENILNNLIGKLVIIDYLSDKGPAFVKGTVISVSEEFILIRTLKNQYAIKLSNVSKIRTGDDKNEKKS